MVNSIGDSKGKATEGSPIEKEAESSSNTHSRRVVVRDTEAVATPVTVGDKIPSPVNNIADRPAGGRRVVR